jgi:pimeloyl-ACP methyl ester carboxylesterase
MILRSVSAVAAACCLASSPLHAADGTFDSNGVKIRYVTEGKGEAVVLIHGWMGDSRMWGTDWLGNTKLNMKGAEGFQAIAIDCRGHGKSDKLYDVSKYGPEMAADLVRLLDHLKIEKAHLVGYSSGSFIAGKVAATHPGRVLSLVYGGQAPIVKNPKAPAKKSNEVSEVEIFAKAVDEGKDLGVWLMAVMPPDRPKLTEGQAKLITQAMFAGKDVKALAAAGRGFKNLAVTEEELKKCPAPILFLHGANESEYVKSSVAHARKVLGRGEVKLVPGGDHVTTLAEPEFGASLMAFLKANKSK